MTRHTATVLTLLVAGALSMVLFTIKHQVQDLEDEISGLNRSIIDDEQAIHVLKAEWSHLNDPKRLRGLANRHLGLKPVEPEQIGFVSDLPEHSQTPEGEEETLRMDEEAPSAPMELADRKVGQ